jgi:hypothetical protein
MAPRLLPILLIWSFRSALAARFADAAWARLFAEGVFFDCNLSQRGPSPLTLKGMSHRSVQEGIFVEVLILAFVLFFTWHHLVLSVSSVRLWRGVEMPRGIGRRH